MDDLLVFVYTLGLGLAGWFLGAEIIEVFFRWYYGM